MCSPPAALFFLDMRLPFMFNAAEVRFAGGRSVRFSWSRAALPEDPSSRVNDAARPGPQAKGDRVHGRGNG
jgi:hypothetical protein